MRIIIWILSRSQIKENIRQPTDVFYFENSLQIYLHKNSRNKKKKPLGF
jgi:hypothetical protein